ncbi:MULTISPECIES: hypothetical protein [unclassified Mesorhizobium]|uniref:hypothetical protein n=1 Tax=unclassified Mesorhizobium TaxID=325217 RepID=UPI00333DEE41
MFTYVGVRKAVRGNIVGYAFCSDASITAEGKAKRALCMYSHGNPRDHIDHSCHRRAFWVFMNAGVKQVLACSTVGAIVAA